MSKSRSAINWGGSVEVLYRNGDPDAAYPRLLDMTTAGRSHLDYPDVSYSVIGAIVNGTIGITLEATPPLLAAVEAEPSA